MSMAWVAIGTTAATIGTTIGLSASGAGQPGQPNLPASSAQLSNLQAALLPIQRQLMAAAQMGEAVTVNLPEHFETQQFVRIPAGSSGGAGSGAAAGAAAGSIVPGIGTALGAGLGAIAGGLFGGGPETVDVPYVASEWEQGGRYYHLTHNGSQAPHIFDKQVKVPEGPKTFDFSGYGTADVQSKIAAEMARNGLDLSAKYDSQFIDAALEQQRLADPEAFAARQKMDELIKEQISRPQNEPVADMLNEQVRKTLAAANDSSLTDMDRARLEASVEQALRSRGGDATGGAEGFEQPLTQGFEGEQRRMDAIRAGTGWLASGSSPEDIAYRRGQQNLANLAAEVNGRTPESQFSSMSGAQNGPTPVRTAAPLPTLPNNDAAAQGVALENWRTSTQASAGQANPWMTGLSSLINLGSVAGGLGWRPFGAR